MSNLDSRVGMLSVMGILEIIKNLEPQDVMSIISTALDYYEVNNVENGKDEMGAVEMVECMNVIMNMEHSTAGSYDRCKKEFEYWNNNWRNILHEIHNTEEDTDLERE